MHKIENLIFSGGGVKGVGLGGAISVLEQLGMLTDVTGFAGTSIGAWFATMMAVGYCGHELRQMMLHEFNYDNVIGEMSILRLLTDSKAFGLNNGAGLRRIIDEKIRNKLGASTITFQELWQTTGRVLKIYVTNLNLGIAQELNHVTHPNMQIALAVRASMSLPFIFDPVLYRGDYLIDGGMLCNFPKHAFPAHNSLGFHFVKTLAEDLTGLAEPLRETIYSRSDYMQQLLMCSMREGFSHNLQPDLIVVDIQVNNTKARDFELTHADKVYLDWLGFKSIYLWLQKMNIKIDLDTDNGYDPVYYSPSSADMNTEFY